MKRVKLNGFTSMFLLFSVLMITLFMMQDDKIELYEHVSIEHGDTLWSLAEQYRGKMAKHDWINEVKKENGMLDEKVVLGQVLVVPIEKDSQYIAQQNESSYMQSIKVARGNNDKN